MTGRLVSGGKQPFHYAPFRLPEVGQARVRVSRVLTHTLAEVFGSSANIWVSGGLPVYLNARSRMRKNDSGLEPVNNKTVAGGVAGHLRQSPGVFRGASCVGAF